MNFTIAVLPSTLLGTIPVGMWLYLKGTLTSAEFAICSILSLGIITPLIWFTTASVDPENEHYIQEAITALTHGKTIIIIAHRLATIENADQILVVDSGKIVQKGTHSKLLKEDGIYSRFLNIRKKAEGWSI